jgi:CheY-like chemotaxis protein
MMAEDERRASRAGEMIEQIREAGKRAAALTSQLLAFGRKSIVKSEPVDINAILGDLQKILRRLIGEDIILSIVPSADLGTVLADPTQIEQVVLNLAVNARDAMPTGGSLMIETRNIVLEGNFIGADMDVAPGPYVVLALSDTGIGMSDETRLHIFEPFFTTKGLGKGTGLGLATIYGIVKQCGGHISVYSEPGQGSTFKIYLPRIETAAKDVGKAASEPPRDVTGSETILLAEDEDGVRKFTRAALEAAGYKVLAASSGQEALDLAAAQGGEIDLLLSDVVMPRMSGSELAERLRHARPGIAVLLMSGHTDEAVIRHGVLAAEVNFIQKPFTAAALKVQIRKLLDDNRAE